MFAAWDENRATEIIAQFAGTEGAALPMLHALQAEFGFLPDAALLAVADALNLSRAEIHGIVSFYHDFRRALPGRHVLKLCRAEACQAMGGESLARQALDRLGLDWGGTTPDRRLTIEATYCLGLCACAPAAMIDGRVIGRLDGDGLDTVIREARG
ncbi:formate dehydrogenase subunit gamma [Ferrovibrio sp.]|uniref:formate dehydrogenase subunit gamma n=1 Tax=Ferrovibrio sp. TaxID=1917215 RepID=UPI00311F0B31